MSKRLPREAQLDHLDSLVDAYAALAGYFNRVEDLELAITGAYVQAVETDAVFSHLPSILGTGVKPAELLVSKAAWLAEHLLESRALCVGNRIVTKRDGSYSSPLVDQVEQLLGLQPKKDVRYAEAIKAAESRHYHQRIDAMFVDATNSSVFPVKAYWFGDGHPMSFNRQFNTPSLFPATAWVEEGDVPRSRLASLVLSRMVLSSAFPNLNICPCLLLIDPEGWNFQLHAIDGLYMGMMSKPRFDITSLRRLISSVDWKRRGGDLSDLELVPQLAAKNPLNRLPVDRATRSYMVLEYLWELQASSDDLVVVDAPQISKAVQQRHMIFYGQDLSRHDFEDCLERGGYIERPRYNATGYALTASGVGRAVIMRRQLLTRAADPWDGDTDSNILAPIRKQAQLWAAYKSGTVTF